MLVLDFQKLLTLFIDLHRCILKNAWMDIIEKSTWLKKLGNSTVVYRKYAKPRKCVHKTGNRGACFNHKQEILEILIPILIFSPKIPGGTSICMRSLVIRSFIRVNSTIIYFYGLYYKLRRSSLSVCSGSTVCTPFMKIVERNVVFCLFFDYFVSEIWCCTSLSCEAQPGLCSLKLNVLNFL